MSKSVLSMLRRLLFASLLMLPALSGKAQQHSGSDHPLLSRFPDSEIVSVEFDEDINYRLILSGLQRTRGLVIPDESERLRGDVTRIVYDVPQEFSGEDVYRFFREQMQERNYVELFTCSGRGCGSSNYWANDIFRNRILYGPELNQYYLAMRADNGAETPPHLAVYIITRGNRRIYAYVEIIEVGGAQTRLDIIDSNILLETLQDSGALIIPDISFTPDDVLTGDSELQLVANLLRNNPQLAVYIVAHLGGDEALEVLMNRSLLRAEFLRRRLMDLGIDGQRLDARGVGPLAPGCNADDCIDRIELVLQ